MERQQEYELRKKIADAIQNDVDRVFSEKLQLFNHDFYYEILFPLIVLEMNYKMKSEESLAAGLGDSNEYLILVNPLREAIYWYIHRVLISDRKILFSKKRYVPSLGEEYSSRLRVSVYGTGTYRILFSGFSWQHDYMHYCLVPRDAAYYQVRFSWWICLPRSTSTPFNHLFRQMAALSLLRLHITPGGSNGILTVSAIGIALRLSLRTRLTLIRLALIRKP